MREALAYGFDFEWSNKKLFYGAYQRTRSYFDNSELAATGVPQGQELQILEKFRGQIPDKVFTTEYDPPKYDGSGNIRDGLRAALKLLKEAGWTFKGEKLVNDETGQPFEFEILLDNPQFERIVLPFAKNLERMGITARVRTVDTAQYEKRMETFDYDMAVVAFGQSLSPGNEQRDYWGSQAADEEGSRNLLGIKSKVVDELIEELIRAPDRPSLVAHTRALDRVLQYGYYVIPQLSPRGVPRRLLGQVPPPGDLAQIRARSGHLVDRPHRRADGRSQKGRGNEAIGVDCMIAYAIRRILLIIPTLFAIMVVNFVIVQAAPGGPVEQMISRLKGSNVSATERVSGGTGELKTPGGRRRDPLSRRPRPRPGADQGARKTIRLRQAAARAFPADDAATM